MCIHVQIQDGGGSGDDDKGKGNDGKREGQRGRSDPEEESGLLQFLPVAAAASQSQYNHKTCLIFGIICGGGNKDAS